MKLDSGGGAYAMVAGLIAAQSGILAEAMAGDVDVEINRRSTGILHWRLAASCTILHRTARHIVNIIDDDRWRKNRDDARRAKYGAADACSCWPKNYVTNEYLFYSFKSTTVG